VVPDSAKKFPQAANGLPVKKAVKTLGTMAHSLR
jgi:hypothetical protein